MGNTSAPSSEILLMSEDRISRSIKRMAYQIAEENRDEADILVVGIKKRGYEVAKSLVTHLSSLTGKKVSLRQFMADSGNAEDFESGDKKYEYIVLVDDVIFSGKTMFNALQEVVAEIKPQMARIAVLVDRGHRTLPVDAAYVGLKLPTKLNEHVQVFTEPDLVKKVVLKNSSN